jgi:uncharacterized cupredoxin-like copper-binding protein
VKRHLIFIGLLLGTALALAACAPAPATNTGGVATENGVQHITYVSGAGNQEYSFLPADLTLQTGQFQITYQNNGTIVHELMLLDASDPDNLQAFMDAHAQEDATGEMAEDVVPGVMVIPELEDVETGTSQSSDVFDLPAGSYVIACMKTGHYEKGMHTTLTIQ